LLIVLLLTIPAWAGDPVFEGRTAAQWAVQLAESRSAADELARGGAAAVPVLRELLRSQRGRALSRAVWALGGLGEEARGVVPELLLLLRSPEAERRANGAQGFLRIGSHGVAGTLRLIAALEDPEDEVADTARIALGCIGKDAVPALVVALDSPVTVVRIRAAIALERIGPDAAPAVHGLIRLLRDREAGWQPRGQAADALGKIGPGATAALPALMTGLSDDENWVRWRCAIALGGLGDPALAAVPLLIARTSDPRDDVREAAADAIWRLGAVAQLVEAFRKATDRARLIEAFAVGKGRAIAALVALLDDERTGRDAERALARIGWEALAVLPPDLPATQRVAAMVLDEGVRRMADPPEGHKVVLKPALSAKPESVALRWESGSGHGFTLSLFSARWAADGLRVRKLRYVWRRSRRAGVRPVAEVTVDSTVLPAGRARAMLRVLFAATGLRLERTRTLHRFMSSSADFHRALEIRGAGRVLFSGSFTGYRGTSGEPKYVHLDACNSILHEALETCTWKREQPADEDLAMLVRRLDRIDADGWWVAERLLLIAGAIGDRRCLPALRRYIAKEPDNVPRDHRYAIDAYAAISGVDLRPNPFADKDVAATRAKYLAAFAK